MDAVVSDTTLHDKPPRCIFSNAAQIADRRHCGMAKAPTHRVTFIRQWRTHRGYSLDQLAERVLTDKAAIWSLWDRASSGARQQIEGVIEVLLSAKKRA